MAEIHLLLYGKDGLLGAYGLSTGITIAILAGAALGWIGTATCAIQLHRVRVQQRATQRWIAQIEGLILDDDQALDADARPA
jgi:uncharacterized membrane protein YciS (DUF1049 family)